MRLFCHFSRHIYNVLEGGQFMHISIFDHLLHFCQNIEAVIDVDQAYLPLTLNLNVLAPNFLPGLWNPLGEHGHNFLNAEQFMMVGALSASGNEVLFAIFVGADILLGERVGGAVIEARAFEYECLEMFNFLWMIFHLNIKIITNQIMEVGGYCLAEKLIWLWYFRDKNNWSDHFLTFEIFLFLLFLLLLLFLFLLGIFMIGLLFGFKFCFTVFIKLALKCSYELYNPYDPSSSKLSSIYELCSSYSQISTFSDSDY